MIKYTIRAPEQRPQDISRRDWMEDPRCRIRVFDAGGVELSDVVGISEGAKTHKLSICRRRGMLGDDNFFQESIDVDWHEVALEGEWRLGYAHRPDDPVTLKVGDIARYEDGTPAD